MSKVFEGQADQILEEDYHEIINEVVGQLYGLYGNFHDDDQLKFIIKVELV